MKTRRKNKERRKKKILHIITSLSYGGAQENTIVTAKHFNKVINNTQFYSGILCGNDPGILNTEGVKLKRVKGLSNKVSIISYIKAILSMRRYIKNGKFDIVHTHSSVAGILGRIAARLAGTPTIIHTVHGWGLNSHISPTKRYLYLLLERLTLVEGHDDESAPVFGLVDLVDRADIGMIEG